MRKTIFVNEEYYHIYNRGVDKREVFSCDDDYLRFITSIKEFNVENPIGSLYEKHLKDRNVKESSTPIRGVELPFTPLVEVIAYCLNSNHYHFILRQLAENGISRFMQKVGTGYTNHFNKKYNRSGALFQGKFKSIHIDTNGYLLHLSAYVNRNDFIHGYDKIEWRYSSYLDYIGKRDGKLCNKEIILGQFKNKKDYADFMDRTGNYFKDKKEEMKGYLLE